MTEDKDHAMIYLINFFNSRMSAMNKNSVNRARELISNNEISVSDLIDKYIDLVLKNS